MKVISVFLLLLVSSLAWTEENMRDIAKKCGAKYAKSIPDLASGKYYVSYEGENSEVRYAVCEMNDGNPFIDKAYSTDALWKLHAREVVKMPEEKIERINSVKIWGTGDIKPPFSEDPELEELQALAALYSADEIGKYFGKRVEIIKKIQSLPENAESLFELKPDSKTMPEFRFEVDDLSYVLLYKGLISPTLLSSGSELMDLNEEVEDGKKIFLGIDIVSPKDFFQMKDEEKKVVLEKLKKSLSGINYETCAWRAGAEPMIFGDKRPNGCGQLCSGTLDCKNFLKEPVRRVSVCSADKCQNDDIATAKGMMACTRDSSFNEAASGPLTSSTRIFNAMLLSPKSSGTSCRGICVGMAAGTALDLNDVMLRTVTCSPENCGSSAKDCMADKNYYSKEISVTGLSSSKVKLKVQKDVQEELIQEESGLNCVGEGSVGCRGKAQEQ